VTGQLLREHARLSRGRCTLRSETSKRTPLTTVQPLGRAKSAGKSIDAIADADGDGRCDLVDACCTSTVTPRSQGHTTRLRSTPPPLGGACVPKSDRSQDRASRRHAPVWRLVSVRSPVD
jgi:hypothetical protein